MDLSCTEYETLTTAKQKMSETLKKSSIGGKQYLDYSCESRGTLVLHLGGVGKYMS